MKNLDHPHVAHVYDYIEHDRTCVMVEEHLSGGSLADAISKGPISQTQALIWCRDALLGIDHAHRQGVLHRDLKPGNLMLDAAGDVKVADFGIAKVFGGPKLTQTRSEMGTAAYMSPEQIRTPQKAYHLTDVYSMGVVLFELLTGKVPFERDTDFETKQAIVREPPPELRDFNPDISIELQRIVLQAMEKDQHRRYGGCAEFSKRIDAYLEGEEPRRYPWWIPVLLVILTLFVLLFLASRLGWI
jgi:serine/threonine-protein kinase